jgi:hypothetical protein
MARIVFPKTFPSWIKLVKDANAFDIADPAHILQPFLDEEGIVLADDAANADLAVTADTNFTINERLAETKTAERDNLFDTRFSQHRECVQFLKRLYRSNPHKLGDWSVTVDGADKIIYPVDFVAKTTAILKFIEKHFSYVSPAVSPLHAFLIENAIDLANNQSKIEDAIVANTASKAAESDKETLRVTRDNLIAPLRTHMRGIGAYAVGFYSNNPSKAGKIGFRIDTSVKAPRLATVILQPGEQKTFENVANDSEIANLGGTDTNIYKGTEASGPATALNADAVFNVIRGYGTVTLVNKDTANVGKYSFEFNA